MSEALPVILFLHFGHSKGFKPDLILFELKFNVLVKFLSLTWTHLQVSQMWWPLTQWKILVGGTISSRQTCATNIQQQNSFKEQTRNFQQQNFTITTFLFF